MKNIKSVLLDAVIIPEAIHTKQSGTSLCERGATLLALVDRLLHNS